MTSVRVLRVLNPLIAISALIQMSTGFLTNRYPSFSSAIHPTNAIVLLSLITIHLYLNRRWIAQQYFRKMKVRGEQ